MTAMAYTTARSESVGSLVLLHYRESAPKLVLYWVFSVSEFKIKRRFSELPVLAETRCNSVDQGVHLQRHQSGWFPNARGEAEAAGDRAVRLQVSVKVTDRNNYREKVELAR